MKAITLKYTKPLLKRSIRAYWWRQIGPLYLVVTILLAGLLTHRIFDGDRSWFVGLLGTTVFMSLAMMVALYVVHINRAFLTLANMGEPEAVLDLEESRFRVSSGAGSSEIKWSLITQVWCFDEVWLLFLGSGEYMTFPIECMTAENREFLLSKFEQVGAKVTSYQK